MYYFKYFRNDSNFEKTIRYNELYFAANSSLNDPMDLSFNPLLWDSIEIWKQFLGGYDNGLVAFMDYISQPKNDEFYLSINNLFRGKSLMKLSEKYDLFHRDVINIISKHELATGRDIESAATILMDGLVKITNNNNFLSVSFSRDPFNYLMWSHYANGFKGCILIYHFENNKSKLKTHILGDEYLDVKMKNVKYSNTSIHPNLWKLISENIIDNNSYFFTKNTNWKYEKESRLVLISPRTYNGEIFHHDPSLVKGVIFGSRCDKNFKNRTITALRENRACGGGESFLSFNSALNKKNEIEILSGSKHIINNYFDIPLKNDEIFNWNRKLSNCKKQSNF